MQVEQHTFSGWEVKVIALALQSQIEDVKAALDSSPAPGQEWQPEAKKQLQEILDYSTSALATVRRISGLVLSIEKYEPGDEKNFLTKIDQP